MSAVQRSRTTPALAAVAALALAVLLGWSEPGAADQSERSRGHGSITEGIDCSTCHSTAGWKTLVAGEPGAGFDHARTGFPLTGRHQQQPCIACHNATQKLTRQCSGCHEEPHARRLGQQCDGCHSAQDWRATSAIAQHAQTRLPLSGMHALAECTDCHRRTDARRFGPVPADCYACHADDYRRGDVHPLHVGVPGDATRPPFPKDCAFCHRASGWSPALFASGTAAVQALSMRAPADHELRFPIRSGSHRGAQCGDCHRESGAMRDVRCTGCHAHGPAALRQAHAALGSAARTGGACLSCHPGGAVP